VAGRKRHLLVDTLGLILAVVVHAANIQDRTGAKLVLGQVVGRFPRLQLIWADGGYRGMLVDWVAERLDCLLEIVSPPQDTVDFQPIPHRWIVERTFAWLGRYRRLSKDYEEQTASSEAMIQIAMINLMLHRLEPG
jgi:putative transposase